jgi:tRNA 2-selenouridine synthase
VLNDDERARVGYLYKQHSPFAAKRVGAALVARNIAAHVEQTFASRTRDWRPLVYCWRGGGRSEAMCDLLRRIGWQAVRLQGGYQAYRRNVRAELGALASRLTYRVICGKTGAAKSRLLHELAARGAQTLDLEALARHRGSVLGDIPGEPQPTQKMFESLLYAALGRFDPRSSVYVEAESRKVGNVQIPAALIECMRASPCVTVEVPAGARTDYLLQQYRHFLRDAEGLCSRLDALAAHYGKARVASWQALARSGAHAELVEELLRHHYDPAYERSAARNFRALPLAPVIRLAACDDAALARAALSILAEPEPAARCAEGCTS